MACKDPIFIVGCGHSGTTLLFRILNEHENIFGVPSETNFETNLFLQEGNHFETLSFWERETIRAGKKRFLEKTPRHLHYLNVIFGFYPNAKVIALQRNGYDNVFSLFKRELQKQKVEKQAFEFAFERWIHDNQEILVWKDKVYTVKLEDLQQETEKTMRKILCAVNEEFHPRLLHYHEKPVFFAKQNSEHLIKRNEQINQPIFISEPQDLEKWMLKKMNRDKRFVELMNKLGYPIRAENE